jgi:hypothetical protein
MESKKYRPQGIGVRERGGSGGGRGEHKKVTEEESILNLQSSILNL